MTKHLHTNRPAIAAIAAVLAFATSPAGAQPAQDSSADPAITQPESAPPVAQSAPAPEAVAPAEPAQPAPVQIAPQSEVVQAVPANQAEPAAPARVATQARSEVTRSPAPKPAAPSRPAEASAQPVVAPVVTPDARPVAGLTPTTPAVQPAAATVNPDAADAAWWALGGGVLLFAGGLGALALSRGKKRPGAARANRTKDRAPATVQPAVAAETAAVSEPIVVGTRMPKPAYAAKASRSDWPELEELVAQAPSPENPFLTRSKRMRRAKFLLQHEHAEHKPVARPAKQAAKEVKPEVKKAPAAKVSAAKAPADKAVNGKASATYSFGSKAKPRTNWKPATT